MSTGHFIMHCKECDKVIGQCRCPAKDKEIRKTDTCEDCKKKKQEKV